MGDLDRRKHDVDVIERVLGGLRDNPPERARTQVIDVDVPSAQEGERPQVEVTIGLSSESTPPRR